MSHECKGEEDEGEDYNDEEKRYIIGVTKTMILLAQVSVRLLTMVHRMILESEFPVVLITTRNQKPREEESYR